MTNLLAHWSVRVTHRHMDKAPELEHPVATMVAALQKLYLWELRIVNAPEKPPSDDKEDRRRRVDSITCWYENNSWDWKIGAVWEFKRSNASPVEVERCEAQVFDACERYLDGQYPGMCYGFSVIGSFWKVFQFVKYDKERGKFGPITGDRGRGIKSYFDMSDEGEACLIDSCLRDLREYMGLPRHTLHPQAPLAYRPATISTRSLSHFHQLKRNGWTFNPDTGRFFRITGGSRELYPHLRYPTGLRELEVNFERSPGASFESDDQVALA